MKINLYTKEEQASGAFNGGEIIENKPLGFPQDGGALRPFSNLFYWANAIALKDSTIGLHPHQGFEIMSFVLDGRIKHFDTKLNEWKVLNSGDVQIIRAGNGISHAEHMEKGARMFQIWTDPDLSKTLQKEASYDDYKASDFPLHNNGLFSKTIYIGQDSPLFIDSSGLEIYKIDVNQGKQSFKTKIDHYNSIYVLKGNFNIGNQSVKKDDFLKISDTNEILIQGEGSLFVIINPVKLGYKSYAERMTGRS